MSEPYGTASVYDEIMAERQRQDREWGGADHDDQHAPGDWVRFIMKQLGRAAACTYIDGADLTLDDGREKSGEYRQRMVKIAALAVAAIETADRRDRLAAAKKGGGE